MFRRVLLPLGGATDAQHVVRWGASLAEPFLAELILLRVLDSTSPDDAAAESFLSCIASTISDRRFNVRTIVSRGSISEEILRVAKEENVDLIVLATKSRLGVKTSMLNSVTNSVLHTAKNPIVVLHVDGQIKPETHLPKTVLVPLYGAKNSESVVDFAVDFAEKSGALLVFVKATNPAFRGISTWGPIPSKGSRSSLHIRDFAKEYLDRYVEKAKSKGVSAIAQTPTGSTSACIAALANELSETLIVISSRDLGGLKRTVIGSTTDKVVWGTSQSVLVIPYGYMDNKYDVLSQQVNAVQQQ